MNLNSFLLVAIFASISSYGQITTTKVAPKIENVDNSPYDGTINFLGKDVHKYIGEELYLNGMPESLRQYGYEGFVNDYTKRTTANKSNIYKCCSGFNSSYEDLFGKYFTVLDVFTYPEGSSEYILKLQEKESKDVVYYKYKSRFKHSFPFIAVKYFNHVKDTEIGKEFIIRGKNWVSSSNPMMDINSGKSVSNFNPGSKWKCVNVTIEDKYFNLSLIIENKEGEQIPISVDNSNSTFWVFPNSVAENYKTKFGVETWQKILEGKVIIGMTKEACELSWGKPKNINNTITSGNKSEQWVYADNYLYFDNGILTAIQ